MDSGHFRVLSSRALYSAMSATCFWLIIKVFIMGNTSSVAAQTRVGKNEFAWSELNLTCTK